MSENLEQKIITSAMGALGKSIETELIGYNKPLSRLTERVIMEHESELFNLINGEFSELLDNDLFKQELKSALNAKFAKLLVSRMSGEIEKRVNEMKSDPVSRAKVTVALSEMIDKLGE